MYEFVQIMTVYEWQCCDAYNLNNQLAALNFVIVILDKHV
jgi:hypothetical protein